jgi:hypothetical protein
MQKLFLYIFFNLILFLSSNSVFAALPFVTDDAAVSDKNQLLLETYTESWHLPKKSDSASANLLGQYLGFSYGVLKNFEMTTGAMSSYDLSEHSASFSKPLFQIKSVISHSKKAGIPDVAMSFGYVNKNGRGQYYDTATNSYLMAIATAKFFDESLIIHANSGLKTSYNIDGQKDLRRLQLGVGVDAALIGKDIRLLAESYNGAPNSPRDSPGFFHSYQLGFKFVKSADASFNILYGSQPTFMGYDANNEATHRRTSWVQFGFRKAFGDVF